MLHSEIDLNRWNTEKVKDSNTEVIVLDRQQKKLLEFVRGYDYHGVFINVMF